MLFNICEKFMYLPILGIGVVLVSWLYLTGAATAPGIDCGVVVTMGVVSGSVVSGGGVVTVF